MYFCVVISDQLYTWSDENVKGGGRWGHFGGTTFHRTFARLSLSSYHFGTVLAVKGSLRRAQQRRALDGSGPFRANPSITRERISVDHGATSPPKWPPFSPPLTMKIQNQPTATLRKRRGALLRQLPPLQAILRGSLIERYKRCGKPGCKCADGPGHGPKYYLSVSYPGLRPQMDYVPQESYAQTAELLANFHRVREILEAICEINRELMRRREAL